jgi:hypothetical protein
MWGEGKWILVEGNFQNNEEEVGLRGLDLAGCSVGGAKCDCHCVLGAPHRVQCPLARTKSVKKFKPN